MTDQAMSPLRRRMIEDMTRHTSRGFLPWRFAYAGPSARAAPPSWGRHPQTFTFATFLPPANHFRSSHSSGHRRTGPACLKGAIERTRSRGRQLRRGRALASTAVTI